GSFVQEEVNRHIKLQFLQGLPHHVVVGQRNYRIKADGDQPLDFSAMNGFYYFVGRKPLARHIFLIYAPYAGDVFPVFGVGNIAVAGELVAFVSVFASALSVALSGDGTIATIGFSYSSGSQHQINAPQYI